ncbi:hypothetical protein BpHYR1_040595 [Brachionus plicatilis]|uniref:Uncharacterized protein n=1 Tax=Brachionus plicatilis TaxID=10195 RepID=A0A3M7RHQ7_BRAPC|nr:hypothetical protein BpHYR1_040595 [Brachionus plicatilis]
MANFEISISINQSILNQQKSKARKKLKKSEPKGFKGLYASFSFRHFKFFYLFYLNNLIKYHSKITFNRYLEVEYQSKISYQFREIIMRLKKTDKSLLYTFLNNNIPFYYLSNNFTEKIIEKKFNHYKINLFNTRSTKTSLFDSLREIKKKSYILWSNLLNGLTSKKSQFDLSVLLK